MSDDQRHHEPVQLEVQEQKPEPVEPKDDSWGAPLDSIPPERQNVLRALADRQRAWATQLNPDPRQSAFAGVRLTGVYTPG